MIFIGIYGILMVVYAWFSLSLIWKIKEARSIFNLLMAFGFIFFLAARIAGLCLELVQKQVKLNDKVYFEVQLPHDFLWIAINAFTFSLVEVLITLDEIKNMKIAQSEVEKKHGKEVNVRSSEYIRETLTHSQLKVSRSFMPGGISN